MSPRVQLAVGSVGWVVAAGLHAWLGGVLLRSEVVAGLISPQGVSIGGLAAVGGFVAVRLALFGVFPAVITSAVARWLLQQTSRRA